METYKKRSECPLSCSLDVFGDKWSLLIIRDLMFGNKSTYNDFLKSDEGIATNILASRLKGLEENGIIEKTAHPDSKAKILYKLTSKGIDLCSISSAACHINKSCISCGIFTIISLFNIPDSANIAV